MASGPIKTKIDGSGLVRSGYHYNEFIANGETLKILHFSYSATISSVYSESTGLYYATVTISVPEDIRTRLAVAESIQIMPSVQSGGILFATPVSYNKTTGVIGLYVASIKQVTNYTVQLNVIITAT